MRRWARHCVTVAAAGLLLVGGTVGSSAVAGASSPAVPVDIQSAGAVLAAGADGLPMQEYVPITPCRIIDTRAGGGQFAAGATRSYLIRGTTGFDAQGGTSGGCGIPELANAITVSVSAVQLGGTGYFRAWPYGQSTPNASIAHYQKGPISTTGATMTLGSGAFDVSIKAYDAPAGIVVDVTGYWTTSEHVETAGVNVPALNPDRTESGLTETVTTTTSGRWLVSKTFAGYYSCSNPSQAGAWYYLMVDGTPVASTATFRPYSNTILYFDTMTGVTKDVIPAGTHTIAIGEQCATGYTAGGWGSYVVSRSSVTVLP
jgi:hypothetical protein